VTAPEGDVEYLDVDDLVSLAVDLLGDPPPIRDAGLLSAAAGRPQATVFGEDAYSDLWTKVAALMHSIVKHHPLVDGNKRLGWLATAVFLELNGVAVTHIANDEVYDLVIGVTTGSDDVEAIAAALRSAVEM
jgi:death-on-curing protein